MRKNKIDNIYLNIGMWACIFSALVCFFGLVVSSINGINNVDGYDIFVNLWNAIFYLIIGNYFYRSKNNYYGRVFTGVLILAICTYILPAIIELFMSLLNGGFTGLVDQFVFLILTSLVGILFSVALILYSRNNTKRNYMFLLIMGIILFIEVFLNFAILKVPAFIDDVTYLITNPTNVTIRDILLLVYFALESLATLFFGFVYFYTPLFFKDKR